MTGWRVGRHLKRTLYQQLGPEPSDDDVFVGVMDTPALAARVVDALNRTDDRHPDALTEEEVLP